MVLSNGKPFECKIEYRLKSMRSILLKMWESEEYNTIDAMRDIIGIAITWPDITTSKEKVEVMGKFSQLMEEK